jgi:hypothetical protein
VRHAGWTLAVCAIAACALAGTARSAPGLLVGVADDGLKWSDPSQAQRALGYTRDLGIRAVRVTVPWQPGEVRLPVEQRPPVDRMILVDCVSSSPSTGAPTRHPRPTPSGPPIARSPPACCGGTRG